jgi:hypothetical protein
MLAPSDAFEFSNTIPSRDCKEAQRALPAPPANEGTCRPGGGADATRFARVPRKRSSSITAILVCRINNLYRDTQSGVVKLRLKLPLPRSLTIEIVRTPQQPTPSKWVRIFECRSLLAPSDGFEFSNLTGAIGNLTH